MTHPSRAPFIASTPPLRKAGVAGEQGKFTPHHYGEGMCLCKRPAQPRSRCQGTPKAQPVAPSWARLCSQCLQEHRPELRGSVKPTTAQPCCCGHQDNRYHHLTRLGCPFFCGTDPSLAPCQQGRMNSHCPGHLSPLAPPAATCGRASQEELKNTKDKLLVEQIVHIRK